MSCPDSRSALAYLAAGIMKLARPAAALKQSGMGWVEDFSTTSVKLIAPAEILGGLGLIVPALTGIGVILSPIAGICLAAFVIGAASLHLRRHEPLMAPIVLAILALASTIFGFIAIV